MFTEDEPYICQCVKYWRCKDWLGVLSIVISLMVCLFCVQSIETLESREEFCVLFTAAPHCNVVILSYPKINDETYCMCSSFQGSSHWI